MAEKRDRREYNRAWSKAHADERKIKDKAYREKNREKIKEYIKAWYKKHPDKKREYYHKPERKAKRQAYQRQQYLNDPACRERAKERAARHRVKIQSDPILLARQRVSMEKYRQSHKGFLKRKRRELKEFGVTIEQYDAMHLRQGGLCALCRLPERWRTKLSGRLAMLAVDHCHETGVIRGLLCRTCNRGLGLLGDTVEAIERALQYVSNGVSDARQNHHADRSGPNGPIRTGA